jgi:hypothetical protein
VLHEQLLGKWHAREYAMPIQPTMTFTPEGLVLGAGALILRAEGPRQLQSLRGREARALALLSAFHGKPTAQAVLWNIERAAKAWREGDGCLAYIHLAHAGLSRSQDLLSAAYRLEMAQCAMKCGATPRAVLKALHLDRRYIEAVEKAYNPAEPRVPAGSGTTSGEWTSEGAPTGEARASEDGTGLSVLGRMPLPALSFLDDLDAGQVAELGAYASRLLGLGPIGAAVAAFGLLLVPSSNDVRAEGVVSEIPGLRYSWNRDESLLHLAYDNPDGSQRTFSAQLDGDVFRDARGRVIGRVLSGSNVAIDANAVSPDLVNEDEPRFCPLPVKDKRTNDFGLDYENYIKSIVNPENPTPPFMGHVLPNTAKAVTFDDCEHSTGTMVEIKDGYEGFLASTWGKGFLAGIVFGTGYGSSRGCRGTARPLVFFAGRCGRLCAKDI